MNGFRRSMLCLSAVLTFFLGVFMGRGDVGTLELLTFAAGIAAFTYWSLTGWDAADTSRLEATELVSRMDVDLRADIESTITTSGKIAAIKSLRAAKGLGLKEAKEAVEAIEREQKMSSGT